MGTKSGFDTRFPVSLKEETTPMTNPIKRHLVIGSVLSAAILTGCVSKSDYDKVVAENQQLKQQVSMQSTQIDRLRGAIRYTVNSDLLFPSGSYQMSPRGQVIIARLAQKLAPFQESKIVVLGYTDDMPIGQDLQRQGITTNQQLSEKRAQNVMEYMISQGVKPDLVEAKGMGEADPVASNDTEQGRSQNRRVELTLASPGS
jgi:chemotaxis protein MotB